jgi:hypothetical protein
MPKSRQLAPKENQLDLPGILAGNATPAVRHRVEGFFSSKPVFLNRGSAAGSL